MCPKAAAAQAAASAPRSERHRSLIPVPLHHRQGNYPESHQPASLKELYEHIMGPDPSPTLEAHARICAVPVPVPQVPPSRLTRAYVARSEVRPRECVPKSRCSSSRRSRHGAREAAGSPRGSFTRSQGRVAQEARVPHPPCRGRNRDVTVWPTASAPADHCRSAAAGRTQALRASETGRSAPSCRCYGGCPFGAEVGGCGCGTFNRQAGAPDGRR